MAHKFNVANKNKLDNEWRRENIPPKDVLKEFGLLETDNFADIGCGIGYFSIAAADIIDVNNKIFAMDISDDMLVEVEKRAQVADVSNIVTVKTNEYDLKLPDASVSFALVVNVLHEVDDKDKFVKEIKRILKNDARVALMEWDKIEMDMGPPVDHRISSEELQNLFLENGFNHDSSSTYANIFYGETFINTINI
ncbi:MAG: class I SAM-dependent methyltransferase [Acidaminobacteraceae bacterium]